MTQQSYTFPDHVKGDTMEAISFTFVLNGLPLDLTGASIRMDVRTRMKKEQLVRWDTGSLGGLTISDPTNGILLFDEKIVDIEAGKHIYDIEITLASGEVKSYLRGFFNVTQDVTHD